ncbi:hypothetical protein ACOKFD_11670 [Flagellimonas sp. S174]|uniref:hypothetical protein n=1 Tax=Flagellimonas sp. S174 TaxID=3410790 RepID=UPI003BF54A08
MSSIQDMNNRMKQNRNLRPSKRAKFKGDNRKTLYQETNEEDRPKFKEFSEFQIKKAIDKFRKNAKSDRRTEWIILTILIAAMTTFMVYLLISGKSSSPINTESSPRYTYKSTPSIIWNGKLYEPIRVPNTDFFYIPTVGNLDYIDLEQTYRIRSSNMVVQYTSNILFLDKDCTIINKLLPENGSIRFMNVIPRDEELEPQKIIYRLTQDEPNVYGKIYNLEKHFFYMSDLDGKNLTKITDLEVRSFKWDSKRNEILLYFYYKEVKDRDLYGVFNIESNEFRLANRKEDSKSVD